MSLCRENIFLGVVHEPRNAKRGEGGVWPNVCIALHGGGGGLDAVLRNMFQLKICVKRPIEVSRRREVREFQGFIDYVSKQNVLICLVSCVSVTLFCYQIV